MKRAKHIKKSPLIVLTAGGTGGHVYPAEALAEELAQRGYRLLLVTDNRGKNNYKGKLSEIPNVAVQAGALVGKSIWFKIKSLFKLAIGVVQAVFIIIKKKPVCVVGFGGYASFPMCVAAILTGTDLVIHEQNSVMSRTNRLLSKYASLIVLSFDNTKYLPQNVKNLVCGMPVRASIVEASSKGRPVLSKNDKMQILILGGSQGAKVFSDVIPEAIKKMDKKLQSRISIVQQCRADDLESLKKAYENALCQVEVSHFFNNMPELYAKSHLVISRAGASSVFEIAVMKIPALLVPLPTAADNHQMGNALWLEKLKLAQVIAQDDFLPETLSQILSDFLNHSEKLGEMSGNLKKSGIFDAAKNFADAIEQDVLQKNKIRR